MVFVDSNVPTYVAGRDHPLRDPARRFLERARGGDVDICTSTEVLQEILYRYSALKRLDLAASVYDLSAPGRTHGPRRSPRVCRRDRPLSAGTGTIRMTPERYRALDVPSGT